MAVDHAVGAVVIPAPREVQQLVARQHTVFALHQRPQQGKFLGRQRDRLPARRHRAARGVEHERPRRQHIVLRQPLGAADKRLRFSI